MALAITGGAGFIGSQLAVTALEAGWRVVVVDDLSTGHVEAIADGAAFVHGDAGSQPLMTKVLKDHDVEYVLHLAARTASHGSMLRPLDCYRTNIGGMIGLLGACAAAGVRRLVFASSAAVYGPGRALVDEAACIGPETPYGRSKHMGETILRDVSDATGLICTCLRYFNVAGADPMGRTGPRGDNAAHLFKIGCQAATGAVECVQVNGADWPTRDGACIRDYVHVHDVARAHLLALDRQQQTPDGGFEIFNLGSGVGHSVHEVIGAIGHAAGRALPFTLGERRPGDVAELVAIADRARDLLGWRPLFGIEDAARHAIAWERRRQS